MLETPAFHFSHSGFCPVCEKEVVFVADGPYFRNTLKCSNCRSSARERALAEALSRYFPNWRTYAIHECSPAKQLSMKLKRECARFVGTQFDRSVPFGQVNPSHGFQSEDLTAQTFEDETFDLVVTQDVFEHLFRPDLAIREIARTLRTGGAHICTVPIVRKTGPSVRLAEMIDGEVRQLLVPIAIPRFYTSSSRFSEQRRIEYLLFRGHDVRIWAFRQQGTE